MKLGILLCSTTFVAIASVAYSQPQPPPSPPPAPQPQLPSVLSNDDKKAIAKLFNEALVKADEHPFRISCSAKTLTCTPPAVFISAAQLSDIEITDVQGASSTLTVHVTAGESDPMGPLIVKRVYASPFIPDHLLITVSKARRFRSTFNNTSATLGGGTASSSQKSPARNYLETQSSGAILPSNTPTSEDPSIGFVSLGTAEALIIEIQKDGGPPQTIVANLNYQRWFVDMGGFITFVFAADQELVTEDAGDGKLQVLKKRRKDSVVPGTGIVLDFHPANYPGLAYQFGIATSVDRAASYFMGFGYRLRELGPRTLATIAGGIAATQVKRFPDVSVGDTRPATATAITQGSSRYVFGPYLSISLGFSFGGVDTSGSSGDKGSNNPQS